jgi:hypothetical protein
VALAPAEQSHLRPHGAALGARRLPPLGCESARALLFHVRPPPVVLGEARSKIRTSPIDAISRHWHCSSKGAKRYARSVNTQACVAAPQVACKSHEIAPRERDFAAPPVFTRADSV